MNSFLVGKAGWASVGLATALGGSMGSRGGGEDMLMGWFSLLKSTKSLSFSRSEMQEASWVFSLSCPISTGVGSNSTAGWKETWPELSVTSFCIVLDDCMETDLEVDDDELIIDFWVTEEEAMCWEEDCWLEDIWAKPALSCRDTRFS